MNRLAKRGGKEKIKKKKEKSNQNQISYQNLRQSTNGLSEKKITKINRDVLPRLFLGGKASLKWSKTNVCLYILSRERNKTEKLDKFSWVSTE